MFKFAVEVCGELSGCKNDVKFNPGCDLNEVRVNALPLSVSLGNDQL